MSKHKKIAYILGCFPDNTPTFVLNEISGLESLGLDITIFSIHKSNNVVYQPSNKNILSNTIYAESPFYIHIILSHLFYLFRRPSVYLKLLFNYNNYGGRKSFWEGIYFSRRIKQLGIEHIHAHFAWKAADIAIIIKRFTNIPYSLTAHQSDIHRTPERLYEKLSEAKFVLTCTKGNKEYIIENYGKKIGGKTFCVYHGVNVENFMPKEGKDEKPVDILCIGNLIKVKGFEYLIEACAILNANGLFEKCLIVGKGEEKNNLESLIEERRLEYKIEIKAPVPYDDVVNLYKMSKLFVLPVTVINGAPHGIPNVLMEAMAMEIPVVTTGIPHIPELIEHKKNGILLMDKDPQAIAEAIDKLLNDDEERIRLGENARQKIVKEFDSKIHITHLVSLFRSKLIHSENTERIKL